MSKNEESIVLFNSLRLNVVGNFDKGIGMKR